MIVVFNPFTGNFDFSNAGTLALETYEHSTASLAPGATEDFSISAGAVFKLLSVESSTPAWVRVYGTTAARALDTRTEPGGPLPESGADYYAELVTTVAPQTIRLSPVPTVQGTDGAAFIRVGNADSANRVISLDFVTVKLSA